MLRDFIDDDFRVARDRFARRSARLAEDAKAAAEDFFRVWVARCDAAIGGDSTSGAVDNMALA